MPAVPAAARKRIRAVRSTLPKASSSAAHAGAGQLQTTYRPQLAPSIARSPVSSACAGGRRQRRAPGQCMGALPGQSDPARARSAPVALRVMDTYQPSICDDLDMARGILRPVSYTPTAAPVARILPRICEIRPRLDAWIRHAETQSAL